MGSVAIFCAYVKSNIAESGRSNIIFINTFLCWICFVFLAKTGQCKRRHFGYSDISFIFHCNVWNYLALEYMLCDLCTLLRNMWAGIGCLFGIVIGLISKAGSSFFGNLGLFSFSFCEPTQLMSESWIYGTLVSFIAGLFLFAVLPMTLKKRG